MICYLLGKNISVRTANEHIEKEEKAMLNGKTSGLVYLKKFKISGSTIPQ